MLHRPKTDTIRLLQRDDLAKQAAVRLQQGHTLLEHTDHNPFLKELKTLAQEILRGERQPKTIAEWIAVVIFYGDQPSIQQMRQQAQAEAEAPFIQAKRWLELLDDVRKDG